MPNWNLKASSSSSVSWKQGSSWLIFHVVGLNVRGLFTAQSGRAVVSARRTPNVQDRAPRQQAWFRRERVVWTDTNQTECVVAFQRVSSLAVLRGCSTTAVPRALATSCNGKRETIPLSSHQQQSIQHQAHCVEVRLPPRVTQVVKTLFAVR